MSQLAELITATATDQIALRGVKLSGHVVGSHQHITIEQTFVNLEENPIETRYTFPLPANAAVCAFEVVTADRTLMGEIDEITKNADRYEQVINDGDGAFLLEQQRPDIFTAWVGNIKPNQAATIRISYVAPVEIYERSMRLSFPTTVSPRYVTASGGRDPLETAIDGESVNPPHVLHVPYGLEMELLIDAGSPIEKIDSPSHAIKVASNGNGKMVRFQGNSTDMDRDIVINIGLGKAAGPSGKYCRTEDGETFAAVCFIPEFEEFPELQPCETIFMIDTSTSMSGSSMGEAKKALALCVRSLNPGDTFNILRFSDDFSTMASEPLTYDATTLKQALRWIDELYAGGGTELHGPLQQVLPGTPTTGSVRQLILLTDGQVANEQELIALACDYRSHNRIFTFAIGHGASQTLTRGLAQGTGGMPESIAPSEHIEEKVLRTFSRLGTPMVSDIRIDWGPHSESVEQAPANILSVFDGDPLSVFARIPEAFVFGAVTLHCKYGDQQASWRVKLQQDSDSETLSQLWARQQILDLEMSPRDTRNQRPLKRRSPSDRMIEISKRYQVLCKLTSFLAVETRTASEQTDGEPLQRRIPVQLTADWGGFGCSVLTDVYCDVSPSAPGMGKSSWAEASVSLGSRKNKSRSTRFALAVNDARRSEPVNSNDDAPFERFVHFLDLQEAEGFFGWNDVATDFVTHHGADLPKVIDQIRESLEQLGVDSDDDLVHTLLVLAALRRWFGAEESVWKRARVKAERWIGSQLTPDQQSTLASNDWFRHAQPRR